MRVLVDSSVWADFFNGFPSMEAEVLATLIESRGDLCTCGVVVSEVFQGLRRETGRAEIGRLFRDLRFLEPTGIETYFRAADVFRSLRAAGRTVRSTIDCVIVILAEESGCDLLARDRDIDAILASGLVKARAWQRLSP